MKTLLINGLKVNYSISNEGMLSIGFYGTYEMTDSEKKKKVAIIGNYLIAEGFVKLPGDKVEDSENNRF